MKAARGRTDQATIDRLSAIKAKCKGSLAFSRSRKSAFIPMVTANLLPEQGLSWYRLSTLLLVEPAEQASGRQQVLLYRTSTKQGNDAKSLSNRIRKLETTVELPGLQPSVLAPLPTALAVRQTQAFHDQITAQLGLVPLPRRNPHPLHSKLINIGVSGRNRSAFIEQFSQQTGRRVVIDTQALNEIGISVDSLGASLSGVSAFDYLETITFIFGITWREDGQVIEITTIDASEGRLEERQVTLPPVLASDYGRLLKELVNPDSWEELGGPGCVEDARGNRLRISQTSHTLRAIEQLSANVR